MEFKTSSSYYYGSPRNTFPNPNNISYFPHLSIAGYANASPEKRRREFHRDPNLDFRYLIQRELEKEKIRAEIIAEEILRRKLLEEEVRRELMINREIAMNYVREFRLDSTIRFESRERIPPLLMNFEDRETRFCESKTLPFQRDSVVARNVDGKRLSLGVKLEEIKEIKGFGLDGNKDEVVLMAKPNPTDKALAPDLKRKELTPTIEAPIDPSPCLKKLKTKDEWSCALCKVTTTSERALKDHLQGKKHKSKERGLIPQKTGLGIGPSPLPDTDSYLAQPKLKKKSKASSLKAMKARKKGKRFVKKGVDKEGTKTDSRVANTFSGMNRKRRQTKKQ